MEIQYALALLMICSSGTRNLFVKDKQPVDKRLSIEAKFDCPRYNVFLHGVLNNLSFNVAGVRLCQPRVVR